jgi:hypothetical protein
MQYKQHNKIKGNWGEERAAELLKRKGYSIIAMQLTSSPRKEMKLSLWR